MAALLRERAAAVNPEALSLIVNDKRAELSERPRWPARCPSPSGCRCAGAPSSSWRRRAGRATRSRALEALEQDARESDPGNWQRYRAGARLVEAMAYMRLAEEQNCHAAHEPRLLPAADPRAAASTSSARARTRAIEILDA